MAVITPNTDLYLLKVPLEINDINQLDFSNATAQFNYFNSLPKLTVDDFTYQRKDNVIRFPAQFDEVISYNYVMYRNDSYSNKWFYAFITNTEYINDNMTMISIKTDVWQTWQFDLTYKPCLIEREHTNDDTIGSNVLPENLELGELVVNGRTSNFGVGSRGLMVVADVTQIENAGTNQTLTYSLASGGNPPDSFANGIPSGTYHIVIGYGNLITKSVQAFVDLYDKAGLSDSIVNIYILPANIINQNQIEQGLTLSTTGSAPPFSVSGLGIVSSQLRDVTHMLINAHYSRPNTIDGYTPKNNKLLTYPFNYVNVSNNAGTTIPFHYEDFTGVGAYANGVNFEVEGTFCPSGSIKAVPLDYKNQSYQDQDNAYDFSISGAKYPICSWKSDSYTNWLTQNAVNMQTEWKTASIATALGVAGGAVRGGMAGGLVGAGVGALTGLIENGGQLISTAREQMLAKTTANMIPDQAKGNINAGDVVFSKWASQFTFIPMSIKAQYARCADDYLSMFGYATNRVKLPNLTGRRNWNYVKTIGCYIEADIPQEDLAEIKAKFDNGITIWHHANTFADYSQNNDII